MVSGIRRWLATVAGVLVACGTLLAEETEELSQQAVGNLYVSYAVFALLGVMAVYLVFKGTRTR